MYKIQNKSRTSYILDHLFSLSDPTWEIADAFRNIFSGGSGGIATLSSLLPKRLRVFGTVKQLYTQSAPPERLADDENTASPEFIACLRQQIREETRRSPRLNASQKRRPGTRRCKDADGQPHPSSATVQGPNDCPASNNPIMAEGTRSQEAQQSISPYPERYVAIPEPYDGTTDFNIWLRQFNVCVTANRWDETKKLQILPTRLRGKAFFAYSSIPDVDSLNFEEVINALRKIIEPPELQGVLRLEFRNRKKRADETLDDFYQELSIMARQAYPGMPREAQDELIKDQFLQGLPFSLRDRVMQGRPQTASQALTYAREQNAWMSTAPTHQPELAALHQKLDDLALQFQRHQYSPRPTGVPLQSTGPCWSCGRMGHRARDCRARPTEQPHYAHRQDFGQPLMQQRYLPDPYYAPNTTPGWRPNSRAYPTASYPPVRPSASHWENVPHSLNYQDQSYAREARRVRWHPRTYDALQWQSDTNGRPGHTQPQRDEHQVDPPATPPPGHFDNPDHATPSSAPTREPSSAHVDEPITAIQPLNY